MFRRLILSTVRKSNVLWSPIITKHQLSPSFYRQFGPSFPSMTTKIKGSPAPSAGAAGAAESPVADPIETSEAEGDNGGAGGAGDAHADVTEASLEKMKVDELKAYLKAKSVSFGGSKKKDDLLARAKAVLNGTELPKVASAPKKRKAKDEEEAGEGDGAAAAAAAAAGVQDEDDEGKEGGEEEGEEEKGESKSPAKKKAKAAKGKASEKKEKKETPAKKAKIAKVEGPMYDPTTMRPAPLPDGSYVKILSWNVAGLRGVLKKDPEALKKLIEAEQPDVLCLQEHKLSSKDVMEVQSKLSAQLPKYRAHWACSDEKKGYSGVAILSRLKTQNVKLGFAYTLRSEDGATEVKKTVYDNEGRVVTAEYADFWLVNVYTPNSGEGLKRLGFRLHSWDRSFAEYIRELGRTKPVIVTGDLNCARHPIDIHNPQGNLKSAGFTEEERASFQQLYMDGEPGGLGLVDTFRSQHPGVVGYSYYGYRFGMRDKDKGWRLDYFLTSAELASKAHDSFILKAWTGSDHCPIGLVLKKGGEGAAAAAAAADA